MSFAVVQFINEDGSFSEIPTSWLLEDGEHCYWPNQKNWGQLMLRNVLPGDKWSIEPIRIEGYYDTLEKARRVAQDPEYTSQDEEAKRRPRPNNKWLNFDASDEDSHESIDQPPKLDKKGSNNKEQRNNTSASHGHILDSPNDNNKSNQSKSYQHQAVEAVIRNYEVHNGFLTPIPSTSGDAHPNQQHHEEHECEQHDDTRQDVVDEPLEADLLNNLSVKMEKIYKFQLENNLYLKSIHKKLMKLELHENKQKKNIQPMKEHFPFEEVGQLVAFEEQLNPATKEALIAYIEQIGGKGYKDNVHRCLRAIYSKGMAKSCSWLGQRGNFKIKETTIINIIKDVVAATYTSTTSSDFETVVSEWFRLASSRMKVKKPSN